MLGTFFYIYEHVTLSDRPQHRAIAEAGGLVYQDSHYYFVWKALRLREEVLWTKARSYHYSLIYHDLVADITITADTNLTSTILDNTHHIHPIPVYQICTIFLS